MRKRVDQFERGQRRRMGNRRDGMAALEVVMTTAITFVILGFTSYWMIRIFRVMFSVIGEMVGSPLI